MECLNGASSFGIQHLSSLNKADIIIRADRDDPFDDLEEDDHDDTFRFISRAINAAIQTLPNRPTARFERAWARDCTHFESFLREWNEDYDGLFNEWLKRWQIREEQANQAIDGETELEDETEEEQTNEEEISDEEEYPDDSGSSN